MSQKALPPLPNLPAGRYQHYKGTTAEVFFVCRHSESLEPMVFYRCKGDMWVRPLAMFIETVEHNGKTVPRFQKID